MISIAYTSGEPSGIGPDIAVIYAQKERDKLRILALFNKTSGSQ